MNKCMAAHQVKPPENSPQTTDVNVLNAQSLSNNTHGCFTEAQLQVKFKH